LKEEFEDNIGVIISYKIEEEQTTQWPKGKGIKGQITFYNTLQRNNWTEQQEPC
jgi:hypothetical protein